MGENVTFKAVPRPHKTGMLRCGKLAAMTGLSRMQVFRLAKARKVPGARKTKGGHYYFPRSPALGDWIGDYRTKLGARRMRTEIQNLKESEGPDFPKDGTYYLDHLAWWLEARPKGFWYAGRREIWADLLKPIVDFAKALNQGGQP